MNRNRSPHSGAVQTSRLQKLHLPLSFRSTLMQVIYITPLFWFGELAQNWLYRMVTGHHGWVYPTDPGVPFEDCTVWYSLRSLPTWGLSVVVFSALDRLFERRRIAFGWRMAIAGLIGWSGEWVAGFLSHNCLHRYLQVWPAAPLIYVAISALPLWCLDFALFHLLTEELRSARGHRSNRGERRQAGIGGPGIGSVPALGKGGPDGRQQIARLHPSVAVSPRARQ
jgi:hypothetical protein